MNANKVLTAALIMFPITVGVIIGGQYLINKFTNVMLITKLAPFMKKWEGGLSRATTDTASSLPAPWTYQGKTGWHTNKGITYAAFISNAARLGYSPTAENFFTMPDRLWLKILQGAYVNAFPLNEISHLPRIQAVIITWAWGSGVSGAEGKLARFQREIMGIQDSNITPTEIVKNFKKKVNPLNEKEWFNKLCDRRAEDFKKMSTCSANCKGWLRRLGEFRTLFN